ncbi:CIA30 family protein, partial [Fibrobacterales bacterium]|nr:CIA30 family protein [Fibrobacterales bacterium]
TLTWLSPCVDENIKYELDAISEMASSYNIDGVLLDYIRFQNTGVDFNPACKVKFEKFLGEKVNWPTDAVVGGVKHLQFLEFRQELITDIVRQVRVTLDKIDTSLVLSASVFSHPKVAKTSVGQDWVKWAKLGLVDYVSTMTYTGGVEEFERTIELQKKALAGIDVPLYPILGAVKSKFDVMDLDIMVDQITVVRESGLSGYGLFELNGYLKRLHLPFVAGGQNRSSDKAVNLGHSGPLFNKRYPSDPVTGGKDFVESKVLLGDFEKLSGETNKGGRWGVSTSAGTERKGGSFVEEKGDKFFRIAGVLGASKIPLNWSWAAGCLILKGDWLPMDLSAYKQLRAKVRGKKGLYSAVLQKTTVKDYAHYKYDFTPASESEWTEMIFPFNQFFQASWAKPQYRIFTDVHTICFNPAMTSGEFHLELDDVWLEK